METLVDDPALTTLVQELAATHRVPGLSVGVIHGGTAYAVTQGVTSVDDPLAVTPDTLFMIGSTTKTITATALMRLVDDGRLALEDRVIDHLPGFTTSDPSVAAEVTVGMLVNHTAGWRGDGVPGSSFGDDALAVAVAKIAETPQEFGPGEHASYNNAAVSLAGRILELVTGKTYEEAVTELVLLPLGMTSTFHLPWETALLRAAVGHVVVDDVAQPVTQWPMGRGMHPAGGAISSLRDQLTYARYHLDGTTATGEPPLCEDTRLVMQQPTVEMRSLLDGVGISWLLSRHGDVRLVSHGGNVSNLQVSHFTLAPDHGLAVIVMANTKAGGVIGKAVLDHALATYLEQPERQPLPELPLTEDLLDEYVGSYDVGSWTWAVTSEHGRLFTQMVIPEDSAPEVKQAFANPPVEVVLLGPDQIGPAAAPVETTGDFLRDASGAVTWFRYGMRMARRLETS